MYVYHADRIKELRDARGLTLEDMAERMGKARQQLSIWEHGINAPSLENLLLICNTFDVAPSFFLTEEGR